MCEVKIVVHDFNKNAKMGIYDAIMEEIGEVKQEIGLTILGGIEFQAGSLIDSSGDELQNILDTNIYHVAAFGKKIIDLYVQRNQKCGILVVSSFCDSYPGPLVSTYNASRGFVNYLTKGWQKEYPTMDILLFRPGFVSSSKSTDQKLPLQQTAKAHAHAALRDLPKWKTTGGTASSELTNFLSNLISLALPQRLINSLLSRKVNQMIKNNRKA